MGAAGAVAQTGVGLVAAKQRADSIKMQSAFDAQQAQFNQQLIELQKKDIEKQAQSDVEAAQIQVKQMIGSQKTAIAGQGIEVDGEIGRALEDEAREVGRQDVLAIKNNAWKQAFGLEVEQGQIQAESQFGQFSAAREARITKFAGTTSAIGTFARGASGSFEKRRNSKRRDGASSGRRF